MTLRQTAYRYHVELFIGAGVLCLVAIVIGLVRCGSASMEAGFIVSRDYHPAYWTTVCTGSQRSRTCHPVYHPPRYSVTVADGHHDEDVIYMGRDEWEQHPPGGWMCLGNGPCPHPHDDAMEGR